EVVGRRAREVQRELRLRWVAMGLRRAQRQLGVRGVDARDQIAGGDASPFGDLPLEELAADIGRQADVGGLDVARRAGRRRVGAARARGEGQGDGEDDDTPHPGLPSTCVSATFWSGARTSPTLTSTTPPPPPPPI